MAVSSIGIRYKAGPIAVGPVNRGNAFASSVSLNTRLRLVQDEDDGEQSNWLKLADQRQIFRRARVHAVVVLCSSSEYCDKAIRINYEEEIEKPPPPMGYRLLSIL